MFSLTIETDNAAFEEAGWEYEVASILRRLASRIENDGDLTGTVRDTNGNTVGRYEVIEACVCGHPNRDEAHVVSTDTWETCEGVIVTACEHPGGFRTDDGQWECSTCGHLFASYDAWGEETGNQDAVAAVRAAIARDLRGMKEDREVT